jgi:hypothetical protein
MAYVERSSMCAGTQKPALLGRNLVCISNRGIAMLTNYQEANEFFAQAHRPVLLLGVLALIATANVIAVAFSLLAL